jgi:predicted secreted protein
MGEAFVLELPARATAGYTWHVTSQPDLLALREERFRRGGPALGALTEQELEFSGVRPGEGRLVLEYRRPGEGPAAERLELTVVVGGASPGA